MFVWCTNDGSEKFVNCLVCVYSCPNNTKTKCKTYAENYEKIKSLLIAQRYLTKYGPASFVLPDALKPKKAKKVKKEVPPPAPKEEVITADKPKRKRRTKAEMEEARAKGE